MTHPSGRVKDFRYSAASNFCSWWKAVFQGQSAPAVIRDKPFIQMLTVETDRPMGRPLDVPEIRKLYTHSGDHIRLFLVLVLATSAPQ